MERQPSTHSNQPYKQALIPTTTPTKTKQVRFTDVKAGSPSQQAQSSGTGRDTQLWQVMQHGNRRHRLERIVKYGETEIGAAVPGAAKDALTVVNRMFPGAVLRTKETRGNIEFLTVKHMDEQVVQYRVTPKADGEGYSLQSEPSGANESNPPIQVEWLETHTAKEVLQKIRAAEFKYAAGQGSATLIPVNVKPNNTPDGVYKMSSIENGVREEKPVKVKLKHNGNGTPYLQIQEEVPLKSAMKPNRQELMRRKIRNAELKFLKRSVKCDESKIGEAVPGTAKDALTVVNKMSPGAVLRTRYPDDHNKEFLTVKHGDGNVLQYTLTPQSKGRYSMRALNGPEICILLGAADSAKDILQKIRDAEFEYATKKIQATKIPPEGIEDELRKARVIKAVEKGGTGLRPDTVAADHNGTYVQYSLVGKSEKEGGFVLQRNQVEIELVYTNGDPALKIIVINLLPRKSLSQSSQ